jgi:hypothetical protein
MVDSDRMKMKMEDYGSFREPWTRIFKRRETGRDGEVRAEGEDENMHGKFEEWRHKGVGGGGGGGEHEDEKLCM